MDTVTIKTDSKIPIQDIKDKVISQREINNGWLVTIKNLESAQELRSGGVSLVFLDGTKEKVTNAEIVGLF